MMNTSSTSYIIIVYCMSLQYLKIGQQKCAYTIYCKYRQLKYDTPLVSDNC